DFQRLLHQTIKKVGEDIENFRFNTAVSTLMILFNSMEKLDFIRNDAMIFLKLLAPFAPHFTEESWRTLGNKKSIHFEAWPEYNSKLIEVGEYNLVIQVNGKIRDKVVISKNLDKPEVEKLALSREVVKKYIGTNIVRKIIFVPNRLLNIVI
ncbi:MAG: class I tRNA ligase family protein, partial [Nanoarchaeota archaeon]